MAARRPWGGGQADRDIGAVDRNWSNRKDLIEGLAIAEIETSIESRAAATEAAADQRRWSRHLQAV